MTDASERFLIDTNVIITPYKQYYPFDFARVFWDNLEKELHNGTIVMLDLVKDELAKGDDDLSTWIKNIDDTLILDRRHPDIIKAYSDVLGYLQNSKLYSEKALKNWSKIGRAHV